MDWNKDAYGNRVLNFRATQFNKYLFNNVPKQIEDLLIGDEDRDKYGRRLHNYPFARDLPGYFQITEEPSLHWIVELKPQKPIYPYFESPSELVDINLGIRNDDGFIEEDIWCQCDGTDERVLGPEGQEDTFRIPKEAANKDGEYWFRFQIFVETPPNFYPCSADCLDCLE